jgi:hypothetical protein
VNNFKYILGLTFIMDTDLDNIVIESERFVVSLDRRNIYQRIWDKLEDIRNYQGIKKTVESPLYIIQSIIHNLLDPPYFN